jgi:hypothetical protein
MTWRDHIKVHPAADLFPMMPRSEKKALAADIKQSGLHEKAKIRATPNGVELLDGRNRLDAMELAGIEIDCSGDLSYDARYLELVSLDDHEVVPYIISANIRRRHLTAEQKRDLIRKLLKFDPTKSNRQIAEAAKSDKKIVKAVRTEEERTGEIPQLAETVGKDGKKRRQPVKKAKPTKKAEAATHGAVASDEPSQSAEERKALNAAAARETKMLPADRSPTTAPVISDELREIAAIDAEVLQDDDVYDQKLSLEERWNNSIGHFAGDAIAMRHLWKRLFGDWQQFRLRPEYLTLIKEAAKEWAELAASVGVTEPEPAVTDEEREELIADAQGSRQTANILRQEVQRLQKKLRNSQAEIRRLKKRLAVEADAPLEDAAPADGEVDFSKIESDKPSDFWQRSLENYAASAATLTSYWDHQFGKGWREFKVTKEMVYFADQAAAEWNRVAAELKQASSLDYEQAEAFVEQRIGEVVDGANQKLAPLIAKPEDVAEPKRRSGPSPERRRAALAVGHTTSPLKAPFVDEQPKRKRRTKAEVERERKANQRAAQKTRKIERAALKERAEKVGWRLRCASSIRNDGYYFSRIDGDSYFWADCMDDAEEAIEKLEANKLLEFFGSDLSIKRPCALYLSDDTERDAYAAEEIVRMNAADSYADLPPVALPEHEQDEEEAATTEPEPMSDAEKVIEAHAERLGLP